ncbi:hypothetical protein ACJ8MM_11085 [Lacticaseibacillus paracasei]|uniref:Uncharacterized protein n=1 Tax=Lacticaseibacillus paracasei TaxID=1597 RepID=A0AAP4JJN3_LACPA|nr:hypothetical protein [Lacticaseibacillus paracasei]MDM7454749.1 hypothetical protein [Lacticaseibacillus paracasei]MDM7472260.1 hypothetical protein [Lacticaseibacillus paracasei]WPP12465.1 hypothetical protein SGY26_04980 [Lacticaseibacillus paracasei]WQG47399.1 hypothetical protein U2Q69_01065 [Lacticaseibacillus casei]
MKKRLLAGKVSLKLFDLAEGQAGLIAVVKSCRRGLASDAPGFGQTLVKYKKTSRQWSRCLFKWKGYTLNLF